MTRQLGAYGRRAAVAPPVAVEPWQRMPELVAPAPEPVIPAPAPIEDDQPVFEDDGPVIEDVAPPVERGWRVYMQTSAGVRVTPCKDNEGHARTVNARNRALADAGIVDPWENATYVGGTLLDPLGEQIEQWGCPVDPARPRWKPLARVVGWSACTGCGAVMWPHRVHVDGRCGECVRGDEVADPRPTWPGDSLCPPREQWPEHVQKAHPATP